MLGRQLYHPGSCNYMCSCTAFSCLHFFFFAGLWRFFLRCFLSRSVEESELSSLLDSELLLLDLLYFCLTVLWIGDIANWFTVTTSEWTFDILVLADDSLQLDEWIWTETGFISRALSCLCFSSNSKHIFLSSSATEGILLLQSIRSIAISFWSANFPPGVLGEYFSGNALSKRCVTAVGKAEILLDWNASRFFSPCLLFQFHEWLPLVRVSSSLFLQNAHYVSFLSTHEVRSTRRRVTLIILFVTITSVTKNVTVSTNWIVTSNTRRLHNLQFKLSKMGFNS